MALLALGLSASVASEARAQALDAGALDASDDAAMDAGVDTGSSDAAIDAYADDADLDAALDAAPADAAETADAREDAGQAAWTIVEPETIAEVEELIAVAPAGSGNFVLTLLGLVALITLAWLGGHEKVRALEERFGISQVITSGFPFVLLGVLARAPGIDVLNDSVLAQITPLLQFGLGWIGFHLGFQLDSSLGRRGTHGTATVVILLTALPFVLITLAAGLAIWGLGLGHDMRQVSIDAIILGLAGALSAPTAQRLAGTRSRQALELLRSVGIMDDVVGVVTFACLAAFLHPQLEHGWQLPGVGWVFVTFGMAVVLGLITFVALRGTESTAEKITLLLGAVCLTTGLASTFSLAPLVVCFLAGVVLRNLPSDDTKQLEDAFGRLERPIYHLFLVIVGAVWRPESYEGWLLLPVFVVVRSLGRFAGARFARSLPTDSRPEALTHTSDFDLVSPPMGQLAIAFIVTAQTLHASDALRAMVTPVVVGGIVIEVIVQLTSRRFAHRTVSSDEVQLARETSPPDLPDDPKPAEPTPTSGDA
jgi:hypothetical protein